MKQRTQPYSSNEVRSSRSARTINQTPLVSIIMPARNVGKFVVEAVQSIQNQTLTNWELLIVDDYSTDDTWKKLKSLARKDKRIKLFQNKEPRGISYSCNFMLTQTRGKFIARMDGDDRSMPKRLELQVAFLQKHNRVIACGGSEHMIDPKGRVYAEKYFPTKHKDLYPLIMRMVPIQHATIMVRAKTYKQCHYDESMDTAEDVDLLFQLMQKGQLANISEIIYQYRKTDTSNGYHNIKRTFYLTIRSRINGVLKHGYKPTLTNVLFSLAEVVVVTLLPSKYVVTLYEWYRLYHDKKLQNASGFSFAAPNIK